MNTLVYDDEYADFARDALKSIEVSDKDTLPIGMAGDEPDAWQPISTAPKDYKEMLGKIKRLKAERDVYKLDAARHNFWEICT